MGDDDDDEVNIEFSPLGRSVTDDGVTIEVAIYRIAGTDEGWALEVMDEIGTSTTWDELFPTEQAAIDEFERALAEDGFRSFLADPDATIH